MGAHIARGEMEEAWDIFNMLNTKASSVHPTIVTYNILIRGESERGGFSAGKRLIGEMRSKGIIPDSSTLNALIYGLVKAQQLDLAFEILGKMDTEGPKPDSVTLALLIGGCGLEGNLPLAQSFFKRSCREIRETSSKDKRKMHEPYDPVPFNAYIKACILCDDLKQAVGLLQYFANPSPSEEDNTNKGLKISPADLHHITPDVVSYSTVINALKASANPNAGRRVLALYYEMRDVFAIEPDLGLARDVLGTIACCVGRGPHALCTDDVVGVMEDLEELKWGPEDLKDLQKIVRDSYQLFSEYGMTESLFKDDNVAKVSQQATRKIFRTHEWNEVDSGFRFF